MSKPTRRDFFRNTTLAVGGLMLHRSPATFSKSEPDLLHDAQRIRPAPCTIVHGSWTFRPQSGYGSPVRGRWQTLIFFFRKEIQLRDTPVKAEGWIIGDSRYKLYLNGRRIQFDRLFMIPVGPRPTRWISLVS